jgi:hypothetical protein
MNNPFLLACVLLFAGGVQSEAQAQAQACWAASVMDRVSMDELPMTHPRYAPLHAAMDTLEALVRPNPGLLALPEVRLRIRRDIHGGSQDAGRATAAVIHAQGFGPKTWGRGECELIPQADRIGPRAGISFFINKPTATLNRWKYDEQLTTFLAKPATASFHGWPTFGECAVLSRERRLPWVAVSAGEMLAFEIRERQRKLEAFDLDIAHAFEPFDLRPHEQQAERLRSQGHAQAADALLLGARQRKAHEGTHHETLRRGRAVLAAELEAAMAQQRGASPAALAAPFELRGDHMVVRLDPAFPWDAKRPMQVQLLTVCAPQLERNALYHAPMREAVAALDFRRLAALLD